MRQKYTPEMMMEEMAIAVMTGRCPRCAVPLKVLPHPDSIEFNCPGCTWAAGGSIDFFKALEEVIQ